MKNLRQNIAGFSAFGLLVVGITLVAVGSIGAYMWQVNHGKDKKQTNSNVAAGTKSTSPNPAAEPQKNSLGLTEKDKDDILSSVLLFCQKKEPGKDFKVIPRDNLDNSRMTRVQANFLISNLYCYDNSLSQDDQQGSGSDYLLKKSDSKWSVISADQMTSSCAKIDGYGIPAGFIQCYDANGQPRNPIP